MNQPKSHKWSTICFLVPSSLVLTYFVFYLATFAPSYAAPVTVGNSAPVRLTPPNQNKIVLVKGQTQTVGKVELTYQGIDTGSVVIDITLLDLDPGYAYRRKIPKDVARRGFRLAQKRYQLISASRGKLKLVRSNG